MLIERLAIEVIATDCISQSVADSFITMRLLYITSSGVASIDSTMLASTGLQPARVDQLVARAQRQQHEAELAGLREIEAGAQRHARLRAEQPRQRRPPAETWRAPARA